MIRLLITIFCSTWLLPLRSQETFPLIVLPVRVHLMQSAVHPRLQATLNETELRALFAEVNAIWSEAGIRFELEAIGSLSALNVAPKKWFEKDRNWVKSAIPTHLFSPSAIDVCFVREMGPNGFFYGEPVVVCEKPEFTKVKGGGQPNCTCYCARTRSRSQSPTSTRPHQPDGIRTQRHLVEPAGDQGRTPASP